MSGKDEPSLGFRLVARLVIACVRLARWRVTTHGLGRVPTHGGAVVTWHHTSHTDFLMTAWGIYRELGRPVRFLAMRELWDSKAFGWAPRLARAVPVDRATDAGRDDALRDAVNALRAGSLVMVAPEGGITPSFEVAPMRTGAARMAQMAGVPLIPSASWGTHRLSTTGHPIRIRRAIGIPITILFGEPIDVGPDDDVVEVTAELRRRTVELADRIQRAYPDGTPQGAWWVPRRLGGGAPPLSDDPRLHRGRAGSEPSEPSEPPRVSEPRSTDEEQPDREAS